ncbi:MAG: DUF2911 domain-containing protein [Bacteroidetes bacterium]|nr:DUF2911 domain-containing protein [Bacteroidota bacterium]
MKRIFGLVVLAFFIYLDSSSQQLKMPAPSPPQFVKQDFGLSSIELSYSRPGVKSRQIFGDLIPYGKVWRTGANNATTITFGDDVIIGGKKIAAGKYGLLTIPGASEWIVIITKQLDVTNSGQYKQDQDVVRVTVSVTDLPFALETFSILFNNVTNNSCDLDLLWDKTMVTVPIKTDIDANIMSQIDEAMNKDNRPYFNAAMYYFDNGKDLNKALEWFNKAGEQNPKAYFVFYQKARCQAKLGKKQDAIASAQKSIQLAKEAGNADYAAMGEKLIATLK